VSGTSRPAFGVVFPPQETERIHLLEEWGYDSVWVGEHILHPTPTFDALIVLSAFGARSRGLQLGTSVLLLPLRHPVLVAKAAATVDIMTRGRLVLGIGIGGEYPQEFEVAGVPIDQRGSLADEAIEVIRRLWTDHEATYHGRHYSIRSVNMQPKPVQAGGPPIWVGGRSDAAMRRAGRQADGFMPYLLDPKRYAKSVTRVREEAEQAGRDPDAVTFALFQFICVADSYSEAFTRTIEELEYLYQQDFTPIAERYCVLGPPERCVEQLQAYLDAGAQHIILVPIGAKEEAERLSQIRCYAETVMPKLRSGELKHRD
jgi:probable F420-dependent oxidoreductase